MKYILLVSIILFSFSAPESETTCSLTRELRTARISGNQKRAYEIGHMLHEQWLIHNQHQQHPATIGPSFSSVPYPNLNETFTKPTRDDRWGVGQRIDPNDDIYDVTLAAMSNGDIYTISIWDSLGNDHILVHRSTDGGWNWYIYWNCNFRNDYAVYDPGIRIVNDTIVMWYILNRSTDNLWRPWVRVCLPGAIDICVYDGSPIGGFQTTRFSDFNIIDDSPVYGTDEYIYATWIETHGMGPDSTRIMFARSDELDVSYWEMGPVSLYATTGMNVYFSGTQIAYGSSSDMMWLTAWLHPSGYPTTYDRSIWGWYSTDYGATWSTEKQLTLMDNGADEYDQTIAGAHINTNWVLLFTQSDTSAIADRDIGYCYCMDDTSWFTNAYNIQYEEYLPDVWVDNASTGFYSVCRQDGLDFETILYRKADITNPASWTQPQNVIETYYYNLSGLYGPAVRFDTYDDNAIVTWTNCEESGVYSIWFASEDWYGVHDVISPFAVNGNILTCVPNPSNGIIRLSYHIDMPTYVRINIMDASGRLLETLVNEPKESIFRCKRFDLSYLAQGVYFIEMLTSYSSIVSKITIVK